jgi:hypothetical protein
MANTEQPLDQPLWDQAGEPMERRREERVPVGSVRPVQLRTLQGQQPGPWITADILDISHGGMALLLPEDAGLVMGGDVLLDVSLHPGFGLVRLPGSLRWHQAAGVTGGLCVVGIQFDRPLMHLPQLMGVKE